MKRSRFSEEQIIGTLPIGYADGYTRMLNGLARVFISGQLVPVVGSICMDQCMIDLTEVEEVCLYDEVELFGNNISADVLAEALGTINYEITCKVINEPYISGQRYCTCRGI